MEMDAKNLTVNGIHYRISALCGQSIQKYTADLKKFNDLNLTEFRAVRDYWTNLNYHVSVKMTCKNLHLIS